MYIHKVSIENYRGFDSFTVLLSKLSIIIGENDSGKSNFLAALSLPLSKGNLDFTQRRLSVSDINTKSIQKLYESVINKKEESKQIATIPRVTVTIQFRDPKDSYETEILKKWTNKDEDEDEICYEIKYIFEPKNNDSFLCDVQEILKDKTIEEAKWFSFPIEHYEYRIISTNNDKQISFNDLRHVSINTISAERDDFSDSNTMKSNNILTKLLINTLGAGDKKSIGSAYTDFFSRIEDTGIFKKVLDSDSDFENIKNYVDEIECIPNLPDLKNILSNITLGYGKEFLYQKGLGERNLIFILLLFAYYKSAHKSFNLSCIEEPEAHLSVNNLNVAIDFIKKSTQNGNSLLQSILTTHSPRTINKLKLNNVIVFSGNKAVNFSDVSQNLLDYLRKRPNFDILKLLFTNRIILVEGPTEEMFINTVLNKKSDTLNNIEVISIGQKGYRTFLDIWLKLNKNDLNKKIGVIRDYDNQPKAKTDHDKYDTENFNITVRTTINYTLEDDLVASGENCKVLSELFDQNNNSTEVTEYMKDGKTDGMLLMCDAILRKEEPINISIPSHISEVIDELSC